MTTAITIPNPLPATLIAVSEETMALVADLQARAAALAGPLTAEKFPIADALVAEANKLHKQIEAERKRLKQPITDLAQALDAAAGEALVPLVGIKLDLGKEVASYVAEENRRREAIRRAEEQRIAAERERQAQEAAARRKAEEEARAAAAAAAPVETDPDAWGEEPAAPAPTPAPAPVVHAAVPVMSMQRQIEVAPIKSSSVTTRKRPPLVEIVDPSLLPDEIAGIPLWIPDTSAIEKLARNGAKIPGVRITEVEPAIASKGR